MIEIILAEDHQIVREALRLLLDTQPDLHVLAETGDGLEAMQLVEKHRPTILILDLILPGSSGLEVARRAIQTSPRTKVIILSMHDSEGYVAEVLRTGASGYVLKKNSSEDLVLAIRQVLAGNSYLSPGLNEHVIYSYLQHSKDAAVRDPYEMLTTRERDVYHLAAEGWSNPQIAQRLSLSVRTVEMHRAKLMKKLGVKTQTDLVKYDVKRQSQI
jgi:DNA-binding NarL/FixJ family response regulator